MANAVGAFGKMPALGDFLRIGLPPGFVDPWDAWVQRGMVAARAALGARWQGCYMSAPIWRFTLSAGLCGPWAVQGVLMPSVDRVGREYPLTLAAICPPLESALMAHLAAEALFVAMEDLALAALDDGMTRDGLIGGLAALPARSVGPMPEVRIGQHEGMLTLNLPHGPDLAALLAVPDCARPALWSARLDGRDLVIASAGLPEQRQVLRLYDPAAAFGLTGADA